ncbi:ATP-dependent DNA helicase PcrA [Polystyrenella longa]|uniref:DNA 3'-5' helicase n=1 Tax=Polystyrenella longa TaxID=2528007 RepID=A0A518CIZ5_9PLAN|nr:ATP-dependent helicase [Polystyrenella longa]QDU79190.1 ATP-dependent DNA helicase PcrA [Polystyrenella longa]
MVEADDDHLESLLSQLNDQQRVAVEHDLNPLLIVAGAGTGKTTTLAHRVAWLIATGVDPRRIMLLTFTRRAANEMLRRVEAILSGLDHHADRTGRKRPGRGVWGGTFHSISARMLRKYGNALGLDSQFTILDRTDSEDLLQLLRIDMNLADSKKRFPLKGTCLDIYSRCMNSQRRLEEVLQFDFPWCAEYQDELKGLFRAFVDRKELQGVLDYDDLLVFWRALLDSDTGAEMIRSQFDAVLIDEYQDTNVLQSSILQLLSPEGQGVTVVGDDAQSIYSFRAATVRNILDFPQDFPNTTIVALEQNYRSTQPILEMTNRVISMAPERFEKNLWSDREQGPRPIIVESDNEDVQTDYLISQILEHRENGVPLNRQAVLFRASHHSLPLEIELGHRDIPFAKYGGLKFIETAHAKDLLSFLRIAENPRDEVAVMRVLTMLPGIGRKKGAQLMEMSKGQSDITAGWKDFKPPAATRDHWPLFIALIQSLSLKRSDDEPMSGQLKLVRRFYKPILESKYDNLRARENDLDQLERISDRYVNRASFLTDLALEPPTSMMELKDQTQDADEECLVLSTIHSSKGLEWDVVYLLQAIEGCLPSEMALRSGDDLEEERRLFYVALTRAKHWLYVGCPRRYFTRNNSFPGGRNVSVRKSRFLSDSVLECCEIINADLEIDADDLESYRSTGIDSRSIRDGLKNRWL